MPIIVAPVGNVLRVIKILADEKTKTHLASLGIKIDSQITIISKSDGNLICLIDGGRLALDKNMATKILVA